MATRERKLYLDKNLRIIFGITLTVMLGVTAITPAFPRIVRELGISYQQVALLVTAFTVPGIFITPFLGVLADRMGRKVVLGPSLFIFGIAGTACFFTSDYHHLLALRFIQGTGSAALASLNYTMIGDLYSGSERTAALGYNSSVLSTSTALYPALGGALATIGWNYPFLLSASGLVIGCIVLVSLDSTGPRNTQDLRTYFSDLARILFNREVGGLILAGIVSFIVIYGAYLTYFPLLLGRRFHLGPFSIGMMLSLMSIANALASTQLGRLTRRYSERTLMLCGIWLYAASLALMALSPSIPFLFIPTILAGIANGINLPGITSLLNCVTPSYQRGAVMSANGTMLRIGQTAGPLIMAGLYGVFGLTGSFLTAAVLVLPAIPLIGGLVRRS